jgi:hypothetical protein
MRHLIHRLIKPFPLSEYQDVHSGSISMSAIGGIGKESDLPQGAYSGRVVSLIGASSCSEDMPPTFFC